MSKKFKLSHLIPDDKNHNRHTLEGMELLQHSVNKVGVIESITVSADNKIISGNARSEVMTKSFKTEPIVIETDGTRPVIIKRTDIQSDTKEFYDASILANTTAKKNIDFDTQIINELVEQFNIDPQELGVDVIESKSYSGKNKEIDTGDFSGRMFLKLDYTEDQYDRIKERLAELNLTAEEALIKFLFNE
jgi:hypothetical protein